jgi:hypothetical protein
MMQTTDVQSGMGVMPGKVHFPSMATRPASRTLPRGGISSTTGFGRRATAQDGVRRLVIPVLSAGPKIRYGVGRGAA